jgi:hypothetical protein
MAKTVTLWESDCDNMAGYSWSNYVLLTQRVDGTFSVKGRQLLDDGRTNFACIRYPVRTPESFVSAVIECWDSVQHCPSKVDMLTELNELIPALKEDFPYFANKVIAYLREWDG